MIPREIKYNLHYDEPRHQTKLAYNIYLNEMDTFVYIKRKMNSERNDSWSNDHTHKNAKS